MIARSIDLKTLEALINARSTPNKTFPIALAERLAKVPAEKQRMLVEKAEQARPSTSQLTRWIAEATSTREPHVRAEDVIKTRCDSVVNAVASLKKRTDGLNTILYRVGAVPSSRDDITLVVSALDGASDSMQDAKRLLASRLERAIPGNRNNEDGLGGEAATTQLRAASGDVRDALAHIADAVEILRRVETADAAVIDSLRRHTRAVGDELKRLESDDEH